MSIPKIATRKIRILCLHGKMQSASVFKNKIGGARRKLERNCDLYFLDGPITIDQIKNISETNMGEASYAWWTRNEFGMFFNK